MTTATVTGPSTWDRIRTYSPSSRYVPVLATLALFIGLFGAGGVRYEGFTSPQVVLNLFFDNAFLIVLARVWMSSAPMSVPVRENRPPASDVPPITTARMASSSIHRPALFASAALVFPAIISPATPAQSAEKT